MTGTKAPTEDAVERKVLFPFKEVTLFSGEKILVRGWSIEKGAIMTQRLILLQLDISEKLGKNATLEKVIVIAKDELASIVADTIEWPLKELNAKVQTYEDFLKLVEAVWETSIHRADGGGSLPIIVRLAAEARELQKVADELNRGQ